MGLPEPGENAGKLAHDMIGNLNHGMSAFYDWNILLDGEEVPTMWEISVMLPTCFMRIQRFWRREDSALLLAFCPLYKAGGRANGIHRIHGQSGRDRMEKPGWRERVDPAK